MGLRLTTGLSLLWVLFMQMIYFVERRLICGSSASYFFFLFYLVTDYNYFSVVKCRPNICTLFVVQMKCFRPTNKQLRCLEICTKKGTRNTKRIKINTRISRTQQQQKKKEQMQKRYKKTAKRNRK